MNTTRFLIDPSSWTAELDLNALFADSDPQAALPLAVDVGCGKGRYLVATAARESGMRFLGIDRLLMRLRRVDRKLVNHGLTNVRLLRIEAGYAIRYLLPPHSVSRYTVFFPDPWPKRRHHRRRLFTPAFLDDLDRTLVPGGELHVATDHLEYFAHMKALLDDDTRFASTTPLVLDETQRTDFELHFVAQGLEIGRAAYARR